MRSTVRLLYLPFMFTVAAVGVALAASGVPKPTIAVVIAVAIAASFAAERVVPYEPRWNQSYGDRGRDVVHAVVNEGSLVLTLSAMPLLADHLTVIDVWPNGWPFAAQVLAALLVADLGLTLAHRASHAVGWLWRLHAVHHSVPRFYGFNGLMKHPLHQAIELTAGVAPLIAFGMPTDVAVAVALCVGVQLLLQHSNVDYATGGLDRWLALSPPHRFHHLAAAGEGDVNFGLITTVWDRWLLGTYFTDPGRRFTSGDLGVAGRPDYPTRYFDQLREPFRASPDQLEEVGCGRVYR